MTGRVMGVDFGFVRVGLALSDPMGILASGLETIHRKGKSLDFVVERIGQLCQEHAVQLVVLGLPRRTDGKLGELEEAVLDFAQRLKGRLTVPVNLQDERYTSVLANRAMQECQVRTNRKRQIVDQIAAEIILQTYLDQHRGSL